MLTQIRSNEVCYLYREPDCGEDETKANCLNTANIQIDFPGELGFKQVMATPKGYLGPQMLSAPYYWGYINFSSLP